MSASCSPDRRVPAGLPEVPGASNAKPLGNTTSQEFAATKDLPLSHSRVRHPKGGAHRRRGPGLPGLAELADRLSERDFEVLQVVQAHRFLTSRHVGRLLFAGHATSASGARVCRRVLSRLERSGLVQRPLRRVGGLTAGSAASVWLLSSRGLRLLNLRDGNGAVGRMREPGERFVRHYLAIADAHVALVEAARSGLLELLDIQIEPACWRAFTGLGGARLVLKPDMYVVTGDGEYEDHWFVEIDRGTESLPTLLGQCRYYQNYRASGSEQQENDVFPRVVWVVPDERRMDKLRTAFGRSRDIDEQLFQVTTPEGFIGLIQGSAG